MGVDEMKCPACKRTLIETTADSIVVEVCKHGCGGIWFDCHELRKVDNANESAGEALLQVERDESISVDHEAQRNCPRCEDQPLMRHFASSQQKVAVDLPAMATCSRSAVWGTSAASSATDRNW